MRVDYIEKGAGHRVILLHSSVATNKQWKKGMTHIKSLVDQRLNSVKLIN